MGQARGDSTHRVVVETSAFAAVCPLRVMRPSSLGTREPEIRLPDSSRELFERVDRLAQSELWAKAELGGCAAAIDHADVADEIELGDRKARDAESERDLEHGLGERMRDRERLATELLQHGR